MDYFELFHIEPSYRIDLIALESAYFELQRQFHPDRVARLDPKAQLEATQQSMTVNEAYETLKNSLKRAKYMLQLQGIDVLDEANKAKASQGLLMEVMELQETKAEATTQEAKQHFINNIRMHISACEASLEIAFDKSDYEAAKDSTIRLSYLYKLAQ